MYITTQDSKKQDERSALFVGGRFDDNGGRPSKISHQVYEALHPIRMEYVNGGAYSALEQLLEAVPQYNPIYWFADIPNDKPKLVAKVKELNSASILVTSKRNMDNQYSFSDLVARALKVKSNLFVEVVYDGRYKGRVADPLGNVFVDFTEDFTAVGRGVRARVDELLTYTRVPSLKFGTDGVMPAGFIPAGFCLGEPADGNPTAPEDEEFFGVVRKNAALFSRLLQEVANPGRFLGNASFRCEEGFPSLRYGDLVYVSRRNIDKKAIGSAGFIGVVPSLPVRYFGEQKPSVDTPIQVALYQKYPRIRYTLHSHTYVVDAPFTNRVIPCGALEEVEEIVHLFPFRDVERVVANMRGHGSIVMASTVAGFEGLTYVARPVPEMQNTQGIANCVACSRLP